jgi:type II secretory ATPase GspE/PulE/Tfp pilus assembly ATPase PilB-like protein
MLTLIQRKKGIILVTGPTGSGKTTTLYAIINRIKSGMINIVTVEDPVEYNIKGINQVQVRSDIGLTFARCLRSILRQDPDVILVGEIRDEETAEIAFRAALTGHLVLSTLHTNNAAATITRLVDIGIPRYIIASTVIGIVAQRLVRRLCPECKNSRATGSTAPAGCYMCSRTGYYGRLGVFEVFTITPGIRDIIDDAFDKVRQGITTREEVYRAVEAIK